MQASTECDGVERPLQVTKVWAGLLLLADCGVELSLQARGMTQPQQNFLMCPGPVGCPYLPSQLFSCFSSGITPPPVLSPLTSTQASSGMAAQMLMHPTDVCTCMFTYLLVMLLPAADLGLESCNSMFTHARRSTMPKWPPHAIRVLMHSPHLCLHMLAHAAHRSPVHDWQLAWHLRAHAPNPLVTLTALTHAHHSLDWQLV